MYNHFKKTEYTKKKNCFNEIYLKYKPRYDPAGSVAISVVSNYRQLTLTNQRRAFSDVITINLQNVNLKILEMVES